MRRESWARKRLFNLLPQFSRLGTQSPVSFYVIRVVVSCSFSFLFFLLYVPRMLYTCFSMYISASVSVSIPMHFVLAYSSLCSYGISAHNYVTQSVLD